MFKIESYVTPILLSYVDKYVKDFKPADAQVSLWGGGVALHNLVLKADVLQNEVALPFTLVSGRIHELLIQVPWTKVMSEPIIVTIDTIECVLSLNPPTDAESTPAATPEPSRKSQPMEAPPGYMQALVRRIVNNIALRVHHLIVKYVQDDIVLSLNVKHLAVNSAGPDWEPAFADIDQIGPMIRRLVRLDDLTLCLDKSDADGKIRFFQEPLLYRCQLNFRVQTQLLSANTRRATNLDVQLRSRKLAFSVSNEQVILLIRLLNERPAPADKSSASALKPAAPADPSTSSGNSAEPARQESWSEWAWSWLPSLADRETGVEDTPVVPTPLPVSFSAYLDDVSLMFKLMETEGSNRKRPRPMLELCATHAALVTNFCTPTDLRVRFLARELTVRSQGKCVCGYVNYKTSQLEPMIFLQKAPQPESSLEQQTWTWPEHLLSDKMEVMSAINIRETTDENQPSQLLTSPAQSAVGSTVAEGNAGQTSATGLTSSIGRTSLTGQASEKVLGENFSIPDLPEKDRDKVDDLLADMGPLVYVDYVHERKPSNPNTNAYENPPTDFEYSDWVEDCSTSVVVEPVDVRICTDLIHRLAALTNIFKEHELESSCPPKRVLTVEEKDSLSDNLPQRCIKVDVRRMRVRLVPWNHSQSERHTHTEIILEVELPSTNVIVLVPLYGHRVCSAACQMPEDEGPLWQGARAHVTLTANGLQARLTNPSGTESRPCARADISLVTHHLLYKRFFEERNSIELSYQLKIKELSVCGSSARLQAAAELPLSLMLQRRSVPLKHTTLPMDALNDEDAVAIDMTLEGLSMRGFLTREINTHVVVLKSAKITALHEPRDGELRQAWLLSAPDGPSSNPYFRMALQWCNQKMDTSFDYCGIWTESLAMSVDPLLISWLAYQPEVKSEASLAAALKSMVPADATQVTFRRRSVPAAGRGRASSVSAELVHIRSRSQCSSEPSDKKDSHTRMPHIAPKHAMPKGTWLSEERMTVLHERMRDLLINVELGLALVYVTLSTVSALDCVTLRDAMERHASGANRVLGICLGRLMINSNAALKGLWELLRTDGPTYVVDKPKAESFPWKIKLADVSCYTLEVKPANVDGFSEVKGQENAGASGRLKSRLKIPMIALPKTVLELVTTTITISVVTKKIMYKKISLKERTKKAKGEASVDEREQYFKAGKDFKPSTLKDFLRGPVERLTKEPEVGAAAQDLKSDTYNPAAITIEPGPVVSLGINLHADTPPVLIRLEQEQVHIVFAAIHCLNHIATLLKRPMLTVPRAGFSTCNLEDKTIIGSVSEMEEAPSGNTSEEMIAIFDRTVTQKLPLKTFFWLQWVVSRVTLVLCSETVKIVLAIEDVISTVDIQTEYNQLKIKLSSLSIKHFNRHEFREDEWVMGVLGGRVLEAREPAKAEEDDDFLAITVTQAQIAALPSTWKEELHPKLLELDPGGDSIWEVYATLAPLEAVLQPNIVEKLMSLVDEMSPRAFCALTDNLGSADVQWPYFYLNAGGLRLLVVGENTESANAADDTIVLTVGKVNVNPHPDNPICRRGVNAGADGTWMESNGGFEGRQYEVVISKLSVETSRFKKIKLVEAASEGAKSGTGTENPALKWSQRIELPPMVHILYPLELSCILAPALYTNNVLTCGPAVELNLVSDCSLEFKIAQLVLLKRLADEFIEIVSENSMGKVWLGSFVTNKPADDKHATVCPYAIYMMTDSDPSSAHTVVENEASESKLSDSGVETTASSSSKTKFTDDIRPRRSLSVVFVEAADTSQFLEVFVTMGVVDLTLNVDDDTPEVPALRLLMENMTMTSKEDAAELKKQEGEKDRKREKEEMNEGSRPSLTGSTHETVALHEKLALPERAFANLQLIHATLLQPNIYYWKRRTQNTLQLSLFNTTIALGTRDEAGNWRDLLLSTAKGVSDPVTGIPPALATFKIVVPNMDSMLTLGPRGYVNLDIERPLKVDISTNKLMRLMGILDLVKQNLTDPETRLPVNQHEALSLLFYFKTRLIDEGIETITVQTSQISVCGHEGIVGWDNASVQIIASQRPEKNLTAKLLMSALLVAAGSTEDMRRVVLQPLMLGVKFEAIWEAWRRAEGGLSARHPTLRIGVELDEITIDLRPFELAAVSRLRRSVEELLKTHQMLSAPKIPKYRTGRTSISYTEINAKDWSQTSLNDLSQSSWNVLGQSSSKNFGQVAEKKAELLSSRTGKPIASQAQPKRPSIIHASVPEPQHQPGLSSAQSWDELESSPHVWTPLKSGFFAADKEASDHYYKDDLRSGAFKILSGGQLPMAYQVVLSGEAVSWCYPHPRAITRIVAYPLPGQDTEIDCVLELYCTMVERWEPHTYFKLPVGEPREIKLIVRPPETVFGTLWRFRVCMDPEPTTLPPFEFHLRRFFPKSDTFKLYEESDEGHDVKAKSCVTAEQLSGVLRVDSYFSPRLLPRTKLVVRYASLLLHLHNSLPAHTSNATYLEGYYVSKPLMRTHRVLTFATRNTAAHALLQSRAGKLLVVDTSCSCDVIDSSTGTMEEAIEDFRLQGSMSVKESLSSARARVVTTGIVMAMQVMRLRTLQALTLDWQTAYDQYIRELNKDEEVLDTTNKSTREVAKVTALALDGRVCLWVHNSCSTGLRVGQEETDEVVPLGSGCRLAYRWRSPTAPKRLRFALTGPSTNWQWSSSVPFTAGCHKLKIEIPESENGKHCAMSALLRVNVEDSEGGRYMHLSGRLVLANMLRENLLFKVRSHATDNQQWYTVTSGELHSETVGRSVVCSSECEMVLKVKFRSHTCWSGDIPLKECPKENVPWLVKVPTDGVYEYVSVWCRVTRGRADGRILATVWPLYVLYSHLPLDTDVTIVTDAIASTEESRPPPPAGVQTIPGRGASTHLQAPGTTSARHSLSFQYRDIGSPVTREAVPMHYGVTDTSVFDKRLHVMNIEDVIKDIMNCLTRSSKNAKKDWPYSVVTKYWKDKWSPAALQPRCDVSVRYTAVVAGGGCSLEVQLTPIVLLCNASPVSLTLRSFDAAPLCTLQAGTAISPPTAIIQKPFYISIEMGRETFVSSQLQVSALDPGRYGTPPPGHVALDHAANFAVLCNRKVALLTLYYEIKEQINVLGVASSYVLINRLDFDIMASAIAVPEDTRNNVKLHPKSFKIVPPTKEPSVACGLQMCKFWLRGRWRGGNPAELRAYMCINLPGEAFSTHNTVPVRLGQPPLRKAVALVNNKSQSVPVVVTQMKRDSHWVVVVAEDPCPQFVVHNRTKHTFAVAQPLTRLEEPSTMDTEAVKECPGTKCCCYVSPNTAMHYSTPAYCERFPPLTMPPTTVAPPRLTFGQVRGETDPKWCAPVVVTDGIQLLQLYGGLTIKLRVRTHPHSTLLELQDVDQNDISASDIRRRLLGAFSQPNKLVTPAKSVDFLRPTTSRFPRTSFNELAVSMSKESEVAVPKQPEVAVPEQPEVAVPEQPEVAVPKQPEVAEPEQPEVVSKEPETSEAPVPETTDLINPNTELNQSQQQPKQPPPGEETDGWNLNGSGSGFQAKAADETIRFQKSSADRFPSEHTFKTLSQETDLDGLGVEWEESERFRCVVTSIAVELAEATDVAPLLALHLDRTMLLVQTINKKMKTTLSIADAQIDNLQYETGQYDFAVVASTRAAALDADRWPPMWNMFAERDTFATKAGSARLLLKMEHDQWKVVNTTFNELTELEVHVGTLALYVEDAYVKALVELSRRLVPAGGGDASACASEERSLQRPLRLRRLHVHPLDLTLTLHTAARMYIALDQSPLRLSAFKLHDMMTSAERLTHALTVHYLSAAILGAGWVVGGLELLGAPGALAARVGGATGGVRGVASAAAAALLRSLSAWAGSLARNLDLLAGDEEHARRAAAARRRPPPSLLAGLMAGITNFAINILGAVGGLAHHPLVGVAVGETESGAAGLRRGLLGALTKPLSATADLVAYAGSGLLRQTGWDPVPEPRELRPVVEARLTACWERDCVRWMFRLGELTVFAGFEVLLDQAPVRLLLTRKFLVVADPDTERIVEMIDFRYCSLGPYRGEIIQLVVRQTRNKPLKLAELSPEQVDDDDDCQISAAAMARVARYTGASGSSPALAESRSLALLPPLRRSHSLHSALSAALHHNSSEHFPML